MLTQTKETDLFCQYYAQWIKVYKDGAVRDVTMKKYLMTQAWVTRLAPDLRLCDVTRVAYQQLLNDYAESHERQTTMDFHHQLKGAIMDAVDDGLIMKDPTRKAIIKYFADCPGPRCASCKRQRAKCGCSNFVYRRTFLSFHGL